MVLEQQRQDISRVGKLLDSLHDHMRLYGYQSIATAIIESADLFTTRAGDQVITKLFTFERHGQQLALRPEFTATAAHRYSQQSTHEVVRWQFSGPIFLDDPTDYQADYQQLSAGAELIGLNDPAAADAEILSMALTGLTRLEVKGPRLIIGHTGLTRQLLAQFQLDNRSERFLLNHISPLLQHGKDYVLEQFDRAMLSTALAEDDSTGPLNINEPDTEHLLQVLLDAAQRGMTMGGRTQHDIARRLLQKRQRMTERHQVVAALDFLAEYCAINTVPEEAFPAIAAFVADDDPSAQSLFASWQQSVHLLETYDVDLDMVLIQPHLARNWEYDTGIVFELYGGSELDLGGGGRYDELVSLIGRQEAVPAVGFALNVDQLLLCSEGIGSVPVQSIAIILVDANTQSAAALAHQLHCEGLATVLLSPQEPVHEQEIVLQISASGEVNYDGHSFSQQDYGSLLDAIRQTLNER